MMKAELKKKHIGVLMGGWAPEREISIMSGKNVARSLKKQGFANIIEIDIDHNLPEILRKKKIEIAFLALHGSPGEDGSIQGLLEIMGIPYTGSGIVGSSVCMNKVIAKEVLIAKGVPTPRYFHVPPGFPSDFDLKKIIETVGNPPLFVKAVSSGSSLGIELVKEKSRLKQVFNNIKQEYRDVFIEEYIDGIQVTVPILENKVLPIIELATKNEFFDYEAKYVHGLTDFIIPARLSNKVYKKVQELALLAHSATYCKCFSRMEFIIKGDTAFMLEINSIPGLTEISTLPASALKAGISYDEVVYKILCSAISN